RHGDVVDYELEEFFGVFKLARQRAPIGDVVKQRDQKLGLIRPVSRDHAVGSNNAFLLAALDPEFALVEALRRIGGRTIRRFNARRGPRPEDLVGALADDVIARTARE